MLILIGALLLSIRLRLLEVESRSLSQQVIDERTQLITFDEAISGEGWSGVEDGYVWTVSEQATTYLPLDQGWYRVEFDAQTLTNDQLESVELLIDGEVVELSNRRITRGYNRFEGKVSPEMLSSSENVQFIFAVEDLVSPTELGANDDERSLGMRLDWFRITPIVSPETTQTPLMYVLVVVTADLVAVASLMSPSLETQTFMVTLATALITGVLIAILIPVIAPAQVLY